MKNKDLFESYEAARDHYDLVVVPQFGASSMAWAFGRWLWLEAQGDDLLAYWHSMEDAGILTFVGRQLLAGVEKARQKKGAAA